MDVRSPYTRRLILTGIVVCALLLTGCSFIKQAGGALVQTKVAEVVPTGLPEALGTQAAEAVSTAIPEEETPEPADEPEPAEEPEPSGETTSMDGTVEKLLLLAPVHFESAYESKIGDVVDAALSFSGDMDAKGNQHFYLYDQGELSAEIYVVDQTLYVGTEQDGETMFVSLGESAEQGDISYLAVYGGAYLLSFNTLDEATRVGSESVNGYDTDKYKIAYDLSSLGLGGLVGEAQGAEWNYEGYAWIDKETGALVKAVVDWSSKDADDDQVRSFHSEFEASPGDFDEITAPENVIDIE